MEHGQIRRKGRANQQTNNWRYGQSAVVLARLGIAPNLFDCQEIPSSNSLDPQ